MNMGIRNTEFADVSRVSNTNVSVLDVCVPDVQWAIGVTIGSKNYQYN